MAPPALDQRVVEHGLVIVFARDHRHLVPDAGIDDPLAVKLSSKAFRVDPGKGVAGAIHAPTAVAPTDDCDEVACLLVVVSCDELGERPLRGSTAQEGDDVLSVAAPLVLADRLAKSDMNRAFGARQTREHAVARIALALFRPLIRLTLPLSHEPPILGEIRVLHSSSSGLLAGHGIGFYRPDDRFMETRLRELNESAPSSRSGTRESTRVAPTSSSRTSARTCCPA